MKSRSPPRKAMKPRPKSRRTQNISQFDTEFVADTFREPPPAALAKWKKAKAKRGRPVQGKGAKVISVSIEKSLLVRADKLARKKGISRAKLIAQGLNAVLAAEGDE